MHLTFTKLKDEKILKKWFRDPEAQWIFTLKVGVTFSDLDWKYMRSRLNETLLYVPFHGYKYTIQKVLDENCELVFIHSNPKTLIGFVEFFKDDCHTFNDWIKRCEDFHGESTYP